MPCARYSDDRRKRRHRTLLRIEFAKAPTSAQILEVLEGLPRPASGEFLLTTTGTSPVSGWSKAKRLLDYGAAKLNDGRALPAWRLHALRRTAATGMQRLGVALPVVEAVLGHVSGSRAGIVGVYQTQRYEAEKRHALEVWGAYIARLLPPT